ncbi:ATP-binding protein [Laspinema sp. D1]|uniref:ATP-binding protein n=1 Tax=Laspinema palackyanum TaxID=3231601 RepID=UPI003480DC05|nr:ATP-binding protein [Laspinema sp. D2b]
MNEERPKKGYKEALATFFESPSRDGLRKLLLDNTGEYNDLDFKRDLYQNVRYLVPDILAMANTEGGVIVFGIDEVEKSKLEPVGIELADKDDKTKVKTELSNYLDNRLKYEIIDFAYSESEYEKIKNKKFRVIIVDYDPRYIPFLSRKESIDTASKKGVWKDVIYVRHNASTTRADYFQLQDIFNRRLETSFDSTREISLMEHFTELKQIYQLIPRVYWTNDYEELDHEEPWYPGDYFYQKNPSYPQEDFEEFVARMIALKKSVIESLIKSNKYFNTFAKKREG